MKNKLIPVAVAVVVMIAAFFGIRQFYQNKQSEDLSTMAKVDMKKFAPDHAPKLGTSTPKVVLVEFLDPECESCRQFYPYVKMLLQEYEGQLQLVIRYAPFHPNSRFAIRILEASRKQGKYWEALETLFRYQPQWGSHHHPQPELIWKYLPEAGVDVERVRNEMNDAAIEEIITKDTQDGVELGVRATPTFFANGRPLEQFSYEALKALIQSELDKK